MIKIILSRNLSAGKRFFRSTANPFSDYFRNAQGNINTVFKIPVAGKSTHRQVTGRFQAFIGRDGNALENHPGGHP